MIKDMSLRKNLINRISDDLGIGRFKNEDDSAFIGRVLFSAIANWTLQSSLDSNFSVNHEQYGISKSHITRKVSKIISMYLSLFPIFRDYVGDVNETDLAVEIRRDYESAGFILPVRFGEYVVPSSFKQARVDGKLQFVRNDFSGYKNKAVGLGMYNSNERVDNEHDIDELLYLPRISAKQWTLDNLKQLKWNHGEKLGESTEYFDVNHVGNLSGAWKIEFPQNCDITLYRRNNWDYGFAKCIKRTMIGLNIPTWLIGTENDRSDNLFNNDVRRFMLGLKAIHHNCAKVTILKKEDCFEFRTTFAIPGREFTALQFLAWRKKYSDRYSYIAPNELLSVVIHIFEKLSITVEEKNV